MGWMYTFSMATAKDQAADIRRQLGGYITASTTKEGEVLDMLAGPQRGVLKDALVAYGHRYYAALKVGNDVTIVCCLLNKTSDKGDSGSYWGYKDMDESMGPCDVDCPLSILNLATEPAPNQYAKDWRMNVRSYWAARNASLKLAKTAQRGDLVWQRNYSKNPYTVSQTTPLCGVNAKGELYRIVTTTIERVEHR